MNATSATDISLTKITKEKARKFLELIDFTDNTTPRPTVDQRMLDDLWVWYRYQRDMIFGRCPSEKQYAILWDMVGRK